MSFSSISEVDFFLVLIGIVICNRVCYVDDPDSCEDHTIGLEEVTKKYPWIRYMSDEPVQRREMPMAAKRRGHAGSPQHSDASEPPGAPQRPVKMKSLISPQSGEGTNADPRSTAMF